MYVESPPARRGMSMGTQERPERNCLGEQSRPGTKNHPGI